MSGPISPQPLISVVMPVYNRDQYVADAIQSILTQTYHNLEFIIVDDGSTDDTPRIIREWAVRDACIHPLFLEHVGVARASNAGIQQAHGELCARMDSDDISLPTRFEVQIKWMREHGVEVCGCCMFNFGLANGPLWVPETHQAIRHELLFRLSMLFGTLILPVDILRDHPLDESVQFDNYALCTQLAPHYRLGNVPQFLMKIRGHDQQAHIAHMKAFEINSANYRRRCFTDLFPNAAPEEWERHELIVHHAHFPSLLELERAGEWCARLAAPPEPLFQQRMALRWWGVCCASLGLGEVARRIFQKYLPQIDPLARLEDYVLQPLTLAGSPNTDKH